MVVVVVVVVVVGRIVGLGLVGMERKRGRGEKKR